MLQRCYAPKYQKMKPSYIGCTVCKEWLNFSGFLKWMLRQDWREKDLDKDTIKPGNRVYSPETCAFVSREVNGLFTGAGLKRALPLGVYENSGRFQTMISVKNKAMYLGTFDTPEQAFAVYVKAKVKRILELVSEQSDPRVAKGLRLHAKILQNTAN